MAIAGIMDGGIAAVGGGVDADGAGGHLRDGDDIGELGGGEPMVTLDGLMLDEREHTVAATESEQADFKEGDE